jgi:hypothetical protein
MYRDGNGFRKLVVVLTSCGKALALHNGDGRAVWAARPPRASAGDGRGGGGPPTHLLRWRRLHDLTHAPQLALLRAAAGGGGGYASVVDGATGRELERIELPHAVGKARAASAPLRRLGRRRRCRPGMGALAPTRRVGRGRRRPGPPWPPPPIFPRAPAARAPARPRAARQTRRPAP